MSFIQTDEYDSGVSGEDGLDTRERQIEQEQFGGTYTDGSPVILDPDGIICHEEAVDIKVNAMLGSLCLGIVLAFVSAAIFAAPFLYSNEELLWRAQ